MTKQTTTEDNSENKIIRLADFYQLREEKEKELKFYTEKMEELKTKLFFIQKEMEITTFIIDMIEKEKITMIGQITTQHKE
jgi:hypothetical protein